MNVLDIVEVIADREEYRKDGIVKGRRGRVFDVIIERPGWRKVYFINFETMKDLGIFYVREEDLKVVDKLTDLNGKEVVLPVKEYARVRLLVDRKRYSDEGVYKGMDGWICDPRTIDGMRLVDFDQYGELPDIAIIPVKIKDLEVAIPAPDDVITCD